MPSSFKTIIKVRHPIKRVVRIPVEAEEAPAVVAEAEQENEGAENATPTPPPEPQEEVLQLTQSEFQQELDFAYKKGLEEGRLDGYRAAEAELGKTLEMMQQVVQEIQQQRERLLKEPEEWLLHLVFKMAEHIIGPLAEQQKGLIQTTLNKILQEAQVSGRVKLLVHPDDLETLQSIEPELRKNFPDLKEIGFVADEMVTRGGCLVETDMGKLDARIETQMNELVKQLRKLADAL